MRLHVKALVGAADRIMALTLPFAAVGLVANILWPSVFRIGGGHPGVIAGILFLAIGVPVWLTSVVQILMFVPRGKLITSGPFALMQHPLYTSVALLVVPGLGLLFDSWLGIAIGAILYASSRRFAPSEQRALAARFPDAYPAYRKRILLPWL